jgi:hypothetical protein
MGQIDQLGADDIAITSRTGKILALTLSGELIFEYEADTIFTFSPVIADFTGDGFNEVIAGGMDGKIYVIDRNGQDVAGFPLQLSGQTQSELAVGRLSPEGPMQFVAGLGNGDLVVIGPEAEINQNYSQSLGGALSGSPVILDNGMISIASNSMLYLIGSDGVPVSKAINGPVAGGLIVADLNRDAALDVLWVSNSGVLWAVTQDGENLPGFPVSTGTNFSCPPLVADLDGDSQYEILLHNNFNSIYAYNHDGSPLAGFPFGTTYNGSTPGTLSDFDNDGYFKLITGFSNGVLMVTCAGKLRAGTVDHLPRLSEPSGFIFRYGVCGKSRFPKQSGSGCSEAKLSESLQPQYYDRLQPGESPSKPPRYLQYPGAESENPYPSSASRGRTPSILGCHG